MIPRILFEVDYCTEVASDVAVGLTGGFDNPLDFSSLQGWTFSTPKVRSRWILKSHFEFALLRNYRQSKRQRTLIY